MYPCGVCSWKRELEAMRKECTKLLRERFMLEQGIRSDLSSLTLCCMYLCLDDVACWLIANRVWPRVLLSLVFIQIISCLQGLLSWHASSLTDARSFEVHQEHL